VIFDVLHKNGDILEMVQDRHVVAMDE